MASERPIRVMTLRVKPRAFMMIKELMTLMGRVSPVMTVERQELRKQKTMRIGQQAAQDERDLHVLHRFADELGGVPHDLDAHSCGKLRGELAATSLHPIGHGHGVGAGLFEHVRAPPPARR